MYIDCKIIIHLFLDLEGDGIVKYQVIYHLALMAVYLELIFS